MTMKRSWMGNLYRASINCEDDGKDYACHQAQAYDQLIALVFVGHVDAGAGGDDQVVRHQQEEQLEGQGDMPTARGGDGIVRSGNCCRRWGIGDGCDLW